MDEAFYEWVKCFPLCDARPIDRLAASLFVNSPYPGGRLMALFTAYFDASGNGLDQPFMVVSGYIANYIQWKFFEDSWTRVHDDHRVKKPFHMAEFMSALNNPNYQKQANARSDYLNIAKDIDKAKAFIFNLSCVEACMVNCVISCIVPMAVYNGVSSHLDLRTVIPPYALAARMCIERVRQWEKHFSVTHPVECIFEEGDFEQGKFTDLMVDEGNDMPIYKGKNDYAGLQGSDHYAWEVHSYLKANSPIIDPSWNTPMVIPLQVLSTIPTMHIQPTQQTLIHLCESRGINPKTGVKHGTK
jgi:Protein of unknown function (DUF3800)